MYFRFGVAILLVVAISVAGIAMEKSILGFRREISRQQFRKDVLREEHERLRTRTQELGAPTRVLETLETQPAAGTPPKQPPQARRPQPRRPLLRWQRRGEP